MKAWRRLGVGSLVLAGVFGARLGGALATAAEPPELTLVRDGQAVVLIVLAAAPSPAAVAGADILAAHLAQMSGATVPIKREDVLTDLTVVDGRIQVPAGAKVTAATFLLVGEGRLAAALGATSADLGPGGILVRTCPNAVVLLGPDAKTPSDSAGTRYAVTTFLEDALGVRYLWPGELGKVVPARQTVTVAPFERRFSPLLRQRYIRSLGYSDRPAEGVRRLRFTPEDYAAAARAATATKATDGGWFAWQRLGGSLGLASGHAFGYVWGKYAAEHLDWFALQQNGSRDQSKLGPDRARLCKSNPDLIAAIANDKLEELRKGGTQSVAIGPNDGGRAGFCTCPACEKLDAPAGRKVSLWDFSTGTSKPYEHVALTDRMVYFWNGIAERVCQEFPEARLTADAYSAYQAPPVARELHPNLVIRFAGIGYGSEGGRQAGLADWKGWAAKAKQLYWRPNLLLAGRRDGLPYLYVHKLAADFRTLAHQQMIGTDFDSCTHNWATQGLNYYVCARLHWDPDLDVDAVIADYCRAGFGAGAAEVQAYFATLEQLTDLAAAGGPGLVTALTPEVLAELRVRLAAAARLAATDAAVQRRLAFLGVGLDFVALQAAIYQLCARVAAAGKLSPEARQEGGALLDRKFLFMRTIFREHHLAVNVGYCCWGEWGNFGVLGWSGPGPAVLAQLEQEMLKLAEEPKEIE